MKDNAMLEQLELVSTVVGTASTAIASGHIVDMTGLDHAVAELCAAATRLPQPHQRRAAQKLRHLAHDLSALAEALATQRDAAEAAARQRASGAYGGVVETVQS